VHLTYAAIFSFFDPLHDPSFKSVAFFEKFVNTLGTSTLYVG